jgi:hypothetical protein
MHASHAWPTAAWRLTGAIVSYPFVSADMEGFIWSLLLGFVLYSFLAFASIVAIGVLVWRAAHGAPIGRSTVPALLIAALAAVQWYAVVRVSPFADARSLLDWFDPVLRVGLLAVVLYPVVWAGRTLIRAARRRQPIEWRNLIMAVLLVAPVIVFSIRVIAVEFTVARIRATASPNAFGSLAAVCPNEPVVCEGVPEFMGGPGVYGLLAWMAIDSLVPPEVVYTLARSSEPIVDLAALRNPRLPVAAYRDRALAVTPDQRRAMMHNPRIPTNVLEVRPLLDLWSASRFHTRAGPPSFEHIARCGRTRPGGEVDLDP